MPQGTIKSFDPETKSGVILDDAKNEIAFDGEAFKGTGMRMFRLGQRVKWRTEGSGDTARVRQLTIVTMTPE